MFAIAALRALSIGCRNSVTVRMGSNTQRATRNFHIDQHLSSRSVSQRLSNEANQSVAYMPADKE